MAAKPTVRSVRLPEESASQSRAIRLDGPVLVAGASAQVWIGGRWIACVIERVDYSTVHVRLS